MRKGKEGEVKEQVDYSLLDVPDAELSGEQIREKRRLRLMKSGAEARERLKQEKEAKEKEMETAKRIIGAKEDPRLSGMEARFVCQEGCYPCKHQGEGQEGCLVAGQAIQGVVKEVEDGSQDGNR